MTWEYTTLGEVAEILRGVTYKKDQASDSTFPGAIPLLRATNIGSGLNLREGLVYVPEDQVRAHQILVQGDIVLASSSGSLNVVGKSARLTEDWRGTFGAFCATIRPNQLVDSRFLAFFLQSPKLRARWSEAARGTNINNLKRDDLTSTPLPLPPLEEQRRIVAVLEDHLSRLDAAEASMKSAMMKLELLKLSALLQLYREAGSWPQLTMHQVAGENRSNLVIGPFGSNLKTSDYQDSGVPLVFVRDIRTREFQIPRAFVTPEKARELAAHEVMPGDVLVTKMGDPPGDTAVYKGNERAIITADCIRLRPRAGIVPEYLALTLRLPTVREQIESITRGVAQRKVSLNRFRSGVSVPVPPLDLQRRVLAQSGELHTEIRRVKLEIDRTTSRSFVLRSSLLSAAFSGRLTGSPPEMSGASEMIGA